MAVNPRGGLKSSTGKTGGFVSDYNISHGFQQAPKGYKPPKNTNNSGSTTVPDTNIQAPTQEEINQRDAPKAKVPLYKAGDDVIGSDGKSRGKAKYDTLTGKLLEESTTTTTPVDTSTTDTSEGTPTQNTTIKTAQDALDKLQKESDDAYNKFKRTSDAYLNGTIPLNTGEQAQINGLQQQYGELISNQKLTNTGAIGTANIRGYQTGATEYDPSFQTKVIGQIFTAGQAKVADLETKMASAVASMTQAFQDADFNKIKDAYDEYKSYQKERSTTLQKTITDVQTKIKDSRDAQIAADKVEYDTVTKPIQDIANDVAKNPGSDPELVAKIAGAKTVAEAMALAGDNLQTGTGDVGDYLFYKKQALAEGVAPKSYEDYQKFKQGLKGGTGGDIIGADIDFTNFKSTLSQEAQDKFDQIPEDDQASVMQLVNGDALLSDLVKSRGIQGTQAINQLVSYALSVDPTFSVNSNKIRYDFKKNWDLDNTKGAVGMRGAINTALGHLADLTESSKKLPQRTIQKMNSVENVLNKNFGDPAVTDFRINLNALAAELARVYKGGVPNEGEIDDWKKSLAENFSKQQFKGAFDKTASLLSSKITSTRYLYKSTMGKEYDQSLIDPDKRQELIDAGIDPGAIIKENVPGGGDDASKLVEQEKQAKSSIDSWVKTNPQKLNDVLKLYVGNATDDDVYQYMKMHPETYGQLSFNTVGGDTQVATLKKAISSQESGANYTAVNKDSGALGKYQILPSNLKGLLGMVNTPENRQKFIKSPQLQEQAFEKLLTELYNTHKGDLHKVLGAYYGGGHGASVVGTKAGNTKQGKYPSVNEYVASVLKKINKA